MKRSRKETSKDIKSQMKTRFMKPKKEKQEFDGNAELIISTGSTLLDLAISGGRIKGGGIPSGILVEIFGPSGCVDSDTEYLTPFGWKSISQYDYKDQILIFDLNNKMAKFDSPLEYIKKPTQTLFEFETRSLSLCHDKSHTIIYKTKPKKYKFSNGKVYEYPEKIYKSSFGELIKKHNKTKRGFNGKFLTTFTFDNESIIHLSDEELRIMVAVSADSYMPHKNGRCYLRCKKKRKQDRIELLLNQAGIPYTETKDIPGYKRFSFIAPIPTKSLTQFYKCNQKQLQIIVDEVLNWDGCKSHKSYYSTNKENADFIQFCFSACGFHSTITVDKRKNKPLCYIVHKSSTKYVGMTTSVKNKVQIKEKQTKDGFMYCFRTQTGAWVMRRNGKINITGNSGKTVLLCEIAGDVQRKGGQVMFRDPEARLNKQFASMFDLNVNEIDYDTPGTVPEVFNPIRTWEPEPKGVVHGIFADSLAALSTAMEMEDGDKMGMRRAKEFSEMCRKTCRTLQSQNFLMVCSNQIRQNLDAGPYGQKYRTPGGEAIGFYASLRLRTSSPTKIKSEKIKIAGKEQERIIGVETEIEIFKSSVWEPYRKVPISIIFNYGIDNIRDSLRYLKTNTKSTTYMLGKDSLGRSLKEAILTIESDKREKELKKEVIDLWNEIEEKFKTNRTLKRRV